MSEDNSAQNKSEYDRVLTFFKYLVTLATSFLALLLTITGIFFYSNVRAIREDAKEEATRVATAEAKARVTEAFDQKNINAMILSAAQEKVGTITDKLINQQLTSKLGPIQQRLTLIGQISDSDMRMRMGFRAGLTDLNRLLKTTNDTDIIRFGKSTLTTATQDYETRVQESRQRLGPGTGLQMLQSYLFNQHRQQQEIPGNLHGVVQFIHDDTDLNAIAAAFLAFRDATGETVKMFDFDAVTSWCSRNQQKCE